MCFGVLVSGPSIRERSRNGRQTTGSLPETHWNTHSSAYHDGTQESNYSAYKNPPAQSKGPREDQAGMKGFTVLTFLALVTPLGAYGAGNCASHDENYPDVGQRWKNINVDGRTVSWRYLQSKGNLVLALRGPPGHSIKKGRVRFPDAPAIVKSNLGRSFKFEIDPAKIDSNRSCCGKRLRIRFKVRICGKGGCVVSKFVKVFAKAVCSDRGGACAPVLDHATAAPVLVTDYNGPPPGNSVSIATGVQVSGDLLAVGVQFSENAAPGPKPTSPDAVYVYRRQGESWVLDNKITGPGTMEQSRGFGGRVAIVGNLMVIGLKRNLFGYRRIGGQWKLQDTITALRGDDALGLHRRTLAANKDIIVSASIDRIRKTSIFVRRGDNWKLDRTVGGVAFVVDVLDNMVVIGFVKEIRTLIREGGSWKESVVAIPDRPAQVSSLALHREGSKLYLALGAVGENDLGFAFVFEWQGSNWKVVDELIPDPGRDFGYGFSIDMNSDGIGVGDAFVDTHAIFIFKQVRGKPKWEYVQEIVDEPFTELYADSVALEGRTVFGGGTYFDKPGDFNATHAYTICDE